MKHLLLLTCLALSSLFGLAKTGSGIIRENGFPNEVLPMLNTQWSQDGGENSLLPIIGSKLAKTGCGATATAQVMRFWSFPKHGFGENYYIWDNPVGTRTVLYANFNDTEYDWNNMIPIYKNNANASSIEIDAVSKLMSDIGIALEMKYKEESTATNIEYISTALKKYFGYNPNMTIHRFVNGAYTMDEWLTIIYNELAHGRPIIMGGAYNGANHIYVADGYDAEGKVHLNLGKASIGSSCNIDGYYDLTVSGQTYNEDMRMLIGISPYEITADTPEFSIAAAGSLKTTLGGDLYSRKLCRIKLTGTLNANDISWLNTLSASTTGQLSYIDMKEASIENNSLPADAFNDCYTLQEIILPDNLSRIETRAFRNCTGLWKIQLPNSLSTIDDFAFSNCRYLDGIELPIALDQVGYNPFRYDKLSNFTLSGNTHYIVENGALLNLAKTQLISMPVLTVGEYKIPDGVESVESQAFVKQCMIQQLYIPASISRIRSNAFLECINLSDIYVYAQTPPTINTNSFDSNIINKCVIHVPQGYKTAYEASDWSLFSNIIDDIENVGTNDIIQEAVNDYELYDFLGHKVTNPISGRIYIIKYSNGNIGKFIFN